MKRRGFLMENIADMENLRMAYFKARRGKTAKKEVVVYSKSLQDNLLHLRESIMTGTWTVGSYHYFIIYDPKERLICAAPFEQRVLHHAVMNVCHADFERYQTDDSYASRIGRGTYAALAKAIQNQDRYAYCLKLDIRKYFDSISHDVLKEMLLRLFKDGYLLSLFSDIIDSYEVNRGSGLPIGNLTSQYFANHYLAVADHYVREVLRARAYVRYMDDMLIWDDDPSRLRTIGDGFRTFVCEKLKLSFKVYDVSPTNCYTTFLGYRIRKNSQCLSKRSAYRYRDKLRMNYWLYDEGRLSQEDMLQHFQPLLAFVTKVDTKNYRKHVMEHLI